MTKLIVQIPCFNEEKTLPQVLAGIPGNISGVDTIEVLVIDDGSTDATSSIAHNHGADHILRHRRNEGLASSFSDGFQAALFLGADIIVNTDGDNQYPGESIAHLVAPILEGNADLVIGDRRPHQLKRNAWTKRILYRIGGKTVSWLAGRQLNDPVSGFRAFSRNAALSLHLVTAYTYTIESLIQACQKGMAIEHVPIVPNETTRPSRLMRSIPSFVLRSTATLLRVVFMYRCLHLLVMASSFLGLLGLLPVIRFLLFFIVGNGSGHLQSLVLGSALLILAALMLLAGLIADLVSHNRLLLERSLERSGRFELGPIGDLWSRQQDETNSQT